MNSFLKDRDREPIINKFVNSDYTKDSSMYKGRYLREISEKSSLLRNWYADIEKNFQISK